MAMQPQAPPFGPLIGASFDRAFTLTARSWIVFLVTAVLIVVAGLVNVLLAGIILACFVTYWYFASIANTIRLSDPGYRMTGDLVLRLIGLSILYGIIVEIGFFLLIIPGIYFANKLSLAPIILAKEDCGITAALGRSWELTNPFFWPTLWFNILAAFAVAAVSIVGYAIGIAIMGAVMAPIMAGVHAGIQPPQNPFDFGGLLGAGLALAYCIYGYAIAYTYQAKDVALYNWYDGLRRALGVAAAAS